MIVGGIVAGVVAEPTCTDMLPIWMVVPGFEPRFTVSRASAAWLAPLVAMPDRDGVTPGWSVGQADTPMRTCGHSGTAKLSPQHASLIDHYRATEFPLLQWLAVIIDLRQAPRVALDFDRVGLSWRHLKEL